MIWKGNDENKIAFERLKANKMRILAIDSASAKRHGNLDLTASSYEDLGRLNEKKKTLMDFTDHEIITNNSSALHLFLIDVLIVSSDTCSSRVWPLRRVTCTFVRNISPDEGVRNEARVSSEPLFLTALTQLPATAPPRDKCVRFSCGPSYRKMGEQECDSPRTILPQYLASRFTP
ncbi:unnamed protein product [Leptosia nina]|uniref:Uncharacterized protein n=1 Tax=Leptosia nina TaxID=320188 RepID=A0AAV1J198_9NEOP